MGKFSIIIFFISYLLIGLNLVKDYGISIDEPTERTTSHWQYKTAYSKLLSIFNKESSLVGSIQLNKDMLGELRDRYYGTFLHWPLVGIEHSTRFTLDNRQVFLTRHIQTFIYFYLSTIVLFIILKKRTKSNKLAILGPLLLILSPRFFAESFYNNKDILFFSWYLFSIFFSIRFIEKKTIYRALIIGIVIGISTNTRIIGLTILPILICWSILTTLNNSKNIIREIAKTLFIIPITLSFYIVSIPTAWSEGFGFLKTTITIFSQFNWNGSTLYFGKLVASNDIPWHYVFGYLLVTTPTWFSLMFMGGIITILISTFRLIKQTNKFISSKLFSYDIFILAALFLPLSVVILSKSVLYNSWRHMYFIYGPFIYIAVIFFHNNYRKVKLFTMITTISLLINVVWIFNNHPNQYLYFNPLIRHLAIQNFEKDYWQLGIVNLLDYILINDNRPSIKIFKNGNEHKAIELMLNKDERKRFEFVDNQADSDYIIYWYYNSKENSKDIAGFIPQKSTSANKINGMTLYKKIEY